MFLKMTDLKKSQAAGNLLMFSFSSPIKLSLTSCGSVKF